MKIAQFLSLKYRIRKPDCLRFLLTTHFTLCEYLHKLGNGKCIVRKEFCRKLKLNFDLWKIQIEA